MSGAYYNEFDPKAAAWLRELIARGLIAPGEVDERDLWDVCPDDIRNFTQVHLCAGIGVWSYALRRAGFEDTRPCWTGSFPCQPFSAAGKGGGFADERHLWPCGLHLIRELKPDVLFGEQVSSKDGLMWFDLVSADLEGSGYAVGAADTCSAGVGAPHIRQRLYWVADAAGARHPEARQHDGGSPSLSARLAERGGDGGLADDDDERLEGRRQPGRERAAERLVGASGMAGGLADNAEPGRLTRRGQQQQSARRDETRIEPGRLRDVGGLADPDGGHSEAERQQRGGEQRQQQEDGRLRVDRPAGPTNGLWKDSDWLFCRDGKWRPVEPGTFPLAHGAPARVGRLRGYGNAINAEAAVTWIESYLEAIGERPYADTRETKEAAAVR